MAGEDGLLAEVPAGGCGEGGVFGEELKWVWELNYPGVIDIHWPALLGH